MPNQIGYVDNANGQLAHYNLLAALRLFCGGFGVLGTLGGTRIGTGTLAGLEASPASVTETWTLTCTAAAANGGTFSVVGSVSGAKADATVGTAYDNGLLKFTIGDGATDFLVGDTFVIPVTQGVMAASGEAWQVLRYDISTANRELILKGKGLAGTDEIFVGVRTYQDVAGDYYNLLLGAFTGYVSGNSFDTQPGAKLSGVPAHNNAITYYLTANAQRIAFILKVGTPVYTHGYVGKYFPYARPSEYPYPVVCAGILNGAEAKRFSDTSLYFPYHGEAVNSNTNFAIRKPDGTWYDPAVWPFTAAGDAAHGSYYYAGPSDASCQVPANGQYQVEPLILSDRATASALSNNIWGELDGVYFVSGFNNAVENVVQVGGSSVVDQTGMSVAQAVDAIKSVGGRAFVMGQNINRTSWRDFIALEM